MFSHYILLGLVRVETTKFTEQIDTVAYLTPEDKIVLMLLNKAKDSQVVKYDYIQETCSCRPGYWRYVR